MPAVVWPLFNNRPVVEVELPVVLTGKSVLRRLVADTGAGSQIANFQLVLDEYDCLQAGGIPMWHVNLAGAYSGVFRIYMIHVAIPKLGFSEPVPAVGVLNVPPGFHGIAAFHFLNRFHYGNFGIPTEFGIDHLGMSKTLP